jgi:two-component system nitrate/nitrite response regulator NarL
VPARPEERYGGTIRENGLQILVVQSHPLLASAIVKILDGELDMKVCGSVSTGAEAAAAVLRDKIDVTLLDFHLPDMTGPAAAAMIRAVAPNVALVFHSAEDSESALLDAIDCGAMAYLTKSATGDKIVEAVRRAGEGDVLIPVSLLAKAIARQHTVGTRTLDHRRLAQQFTARELEVLHVLAEGMDTIDMSRHLGIAKHTVEWHVKHLIEKLGVHSKLQAVLAAARLGMIDLGEH